MASHSSWICWLAGVCVLSLAALTAALPLDPRQDTNIRSARLKRSMVEIEDPHEVVRVLGNLAQSILDADTFTQEKRGLDLGLSRGFSGSQAAKHLMGLAAANFAGGPGRKRREALSAGAPRPQAQAP